MTGNTVALETIAVEKLRPPKNELIKKSTYELSKREKRIERNNTLGEKLWYENGLIMLSIRDENLHKEKYGTFENYLQERWGIGRTRGHQMVSAAEFMRTALKFVSEKPALEGDSGADNVHKKGVFVNISAPDLPRNEGQIRPLIEKLEHNGERLKVWADVVATGKKPTQRLVEEKIAEFKASGVTVPDFDYEPVDDFKITSASGRVMYNAGENDECYTPAYAVKALIPYIQPGQVIWCPFDDESSQFVVQLRQAGFKVIYSHIRNGEDFYTYEPDEPWDVMASNPPFTNKRAIFERAMSFGKPFALVMSNTWLNDAAPKQIFKNVNFQLLMFEERMKFLNQDNSENKITFSSSYFCVDFLPKTIVFDALKNYGY